jgi:hypothetical protein
MLRPPRFDDEDEHEDELGCGCRPALGSATGRGDERSATGDERHARSEQRQPNEEE